MELIELKANMRQKTGKGGARQLRREGLIPAVLYGPGDKPMGLSVSMQSLGNAIKDSTTRQVFINLLIDDNGNSVQLPAMLKELQRNPLSRTMLHADFYKVTMDRKIKTNVPIKVVGKSVGVEVGGMVQVIRRELEIECLPLETPEAIVIDITDLDLGESIHVNDIEVAEGSKILADVNFTVITVLSPKKDAGAESEATEEEEGAEATEAES